MDGTKSREALGESSEAVDGVDVGRLAVPLDGVGVQLDRLGRDRRRLVEIPVIRVQSHGVAHEALRIGVQSVLLKQLSSGDAVEGLAFEEGGRLLLVVGLQEDEEVAELALLEETHQTRAQRLGGSGGNLNKTER